MEEKEEGEGESIKIKIWLFTCHIKPLKFIVNEEILIGFIEGGEFGGKNCEIAIGNGELSKEWIWKIIKRFNTVD